MAKLIFRYGTTGSGKTLDLLKVVYNYEENDMNTILLTSKIDDRYGCDIIKSRVGNSRQAIGLSDTDDIVSIIEYRKSVLNEPIDCILVDEVQFLTIKQIYQLSDIVDSLNIPVICYGLRNDFKLQAFETSSILMAIADNIEEMRTICSSCGKKKSIVSARYVDGKPVNVGTQIEIGGNEKYKPLCRKCYKEQLKKV